ncbi:MAG TPA: hypothetical protein VK191_14410 [Symbiobacteriaceae bacterium]|nr:hypothetical protein [Symbiobacteriaceae bacterium]
MDWRARLWQEGLGLQAGEEALLLVDQGLADLGADLEREGRALGARAALIVVAEPGGRPPAQLEGLAGKADLILSLYSRFELAHADPVMALIATHRRGRWAYGAGLSEPVLAAAFARPLAPVAAAAAWWGAQLRRASEVRVTGPAGTDLRLRREGAPVLVETGAWGLRGKRDQGEAKPLPRLAVTNLPGGEAYFAPEPGSPEGWLVADGALGDIPLAAPVHLCFKAGTLVQWSGDPGALAVLAERFAPYGGLAQARLCEFGVGANPYLKPSGHAALDEKRFGTAHLALTDPSGRLHYDAVIEEARVQVDQKGLSYSFHDYDL